MDVSLATFLVASFLFSALKREEIYESVRCTAERKKAFAFVILIQKAYLDLRRTVLRKKRKRISRVAITRVPTHPLLLLLLLSLSLPSSSSSSRCPFVVRPRRPSPFERRTFFIVAREKDFMKEKDEKKANAEAKKKNVPDRREKEKRKVFSTPFLSFPFQIKILVKESALLSALLRFSFFSLGVFIRRTSRWSRARARVYIYIYIETRDLDAFHSRDETRKRERRKENDVHERRRSRRKKGRGRKKDRIVFSERSFA